MTFVLERILFSLPVARVVVLQYVLDRSWIAKAVTSWNGTVRDILRASLCIVHCFAIQLARGLPAAAPSRFIALDIDCHVTCFCAACAEVEASILAATSNVSVLVGCLSRLTHAASSSYFASLKTCCSSILDIQGTVSSINTCYIIRENIMISGPILVTRITCGYAPWLLRSTVIPIPRHH